MPKPVALVTGASKGIGLELARQLVARGWSVALAARSLKALMEAAAGLGPDAIAVDCDVSNAASVNAAVAEIDSRLGAVDAVVNNAGVIEPIGNIAELDPAGFMNLLQINVGGVFNVCRAVLPEMVARGRGVIVNLSSGAAHGAVEGWSAYCASKAAVRMFTRSLHAEYGSKGVRIHDFIPGAVATDMLIGARAAFDNRIARLDDNTLLPPELPARCLAYIVADGTGCEPGSEQSIRDANLRARVGLEERETW